MHHGAFPFASCYVILRPDKCSVVVTFVVTVVIVVVVVAVAVVLFLRYSIQKTCLMVP